ncbi:unnamed protein product [Sphagnum jensenii]|uniref:Uncharacterized protein n=1 Tax=Sphagnum jensenii TaxID=128206 RepID=A0ABP0WUK9_9BRYO
MTFNGSGGLPCEEQFAGRFQKMNAELQLGAPKKSVMPSLDRVGSDHQHDAGQLRGDPESGHHDAAVDHHLQAAGSYKSQGSQLLVSRQTVHCVGQGRDHSRLAFTPTTPRSLFHEIRDSRIRFARVQKLRGLVLGGNLNWSRKFAYNPSPGSAVEFAKSVNISRLIICRLQLWCVLCCSS